MADNRKLYKEALQTFGHAHQIEIAVKELAAMIHETQKHMNRYCLAMSRRPLPIEIMCAQMRLIFPGVPEVKKQRLVRLGELIKQRKGIV